MAARFQLTVRSGPDAGKVYILEKPEMFLGRDLAGDVVINDAEVSRKHARFVFQGMGYLIEDLGSTNGTVVNGQRLAAPYALQGGEVITIGEHVSLVFEAVAFDPDATIATYRPAASQPPVGQPQAAPLYSPAPVSTPPQPFAAQPVTPPASSVYPGQVPPAYAGQVPAGPAEELLPARRRLPVWLIILLVSLLVVASACGGTLWYIDANRLWCTVMPFLAGCP